MHSIFAQHLSSQSVTRVATEAIIRNDYAAAVTAYSDALQEPVADEYETQQWEIGRLNGMAELLRWPQLHSELAEAFPQVGEVLCCICGERQHEGRVPACFSHSFFLHDFRNYSLVIGFRTVCLTLFTFFHSSCFLSFPPSLTLIVLSARGTVGHQFGRLCVVDAVHTQPLGVGLYVE